MPLPQPLRDAVRGLVRTPRPPEPPETPDGRRLISAHRVIATVLLTLLACALLDANSLVDTVSQERYGTSRSVELSLVRPFKSVSHWTGLDLPLRWLNDVRTSGHSPLPAPTAASGAPPGPVAPGPSSPPLHGWLGRKVGPYLPPPPPPPKRVPSPADPLRVWMAGDSLMGDISESFEETDANDPVIHTTVNYQVGTGLARPDVYNWPAEVAHELDTARPDVVILIFGANDDQDMMVNGQRIVLGTPAWAREYTRRVDQIASAVVAPSRTLIWLEVPPTVRPQINTTDVVIDHALAAAAAAHPGMEVVNLAPPLTTRSGGYTEYLPGSGGQPVQVRDSDGVHLTLQGANRVVPLIFAAIAKQWNVAYRGRAS